jgi:hypothetical protein
MAIVTPLVCPPFQMLLLPLTKENDLMVSYPNKEMTFEVHGAMTLL